MPYCTIRDLAQLATGGWAELAQRAGKDARLTGAKLQAAVDGAVLPPEDAALAAAAIGHLDGIISRTSARVDGYLSPRYRQVMPLEPAVIFSSGLQDATAMLCLLALYGSAVTDEMRKSASWAERYINDLATGKASLGAGDVVAKTPGKIHVRAVRHEMV